MNEITGGRRRWCRARAASPIEFRLDAASGVPTYLQLVHQVEHALRLGYLKPGDQLPKVCCSSPRPSGWSAAARPDASRHAVAAVRRGVKPPAVLSQGAGQKRWAEALGGSAGRWPDWRFTQ